MSNFLQGIVQFSAEHPGSQLFFYCFRQQVLNKQAINQHVFTWDSSWKRLDAQHEQTILQCQRLFWKHSSPDRSSIYPFPAQASGKTLPHSVSAVKA